MGMIASKVETSGVLARSLTESLNSLAEEGLARGILGRALRRAGLSQVPDGVREFRILVEGPVLVAVHNALGTDAAASLLAELRPLMEMASNRKPARERIESATIERVTLGSMSAMPSMLLVSHDEAIAGSLAEVFDGNAHVRLLETTMQLASAIEQRSASTILVIDDAATSVEPATVQWVASLVELAPPVLLWGVDVDRHRAIIASAPGAEHWLRLEARDVEALAVRIELLLRERIGAATAPDAR